MFAFFKLPVSPLPQVDFPTIFGAGVAAGRQSRTRWRPASPAPLERHLGQIADVTEMTSTSSVGQARIVLQFGLDRDINGAARDVQAAINAARADLPTSLRSNPTYRKVNPRRCAGADPGADLEDTDPRPDVRRRRRNVLSQRLSQISGIGQVIIGGARAARGAGGAESAGAVQIRHRSARTSAPHLPPPTPTARRARSKPAGCITSSTPTTRPRTRRTTGRW